MVDCEDVASAIENASVSQCYFWLVNEVLRKLIITPSEQTLSRMESRLNFDLEHYAYIKDEDLRKKILDCVFGREGMGITELKQNKDKEGGVAE